MSSAYPFSHHRCFNTDTNGNLKDTPDELNKLKVVDLKEILRSRGQKMPGTKAELIDRILTTQAPVPHPTVQLAPRSANLEAMARIKSIFYTIPSLDTEADIFGEDWAGRLFILGGINWHVNQPLKTASINPTHWAWKTLDPNGTGRISLASTQFKYKYKRALNRATLIDQAHSIYVDQINVDDPNGDNAQGGPRHHRC